MAIAFAASIGEPPPTAIMKSAPNERASAAPLRTLCTVGLFGTSSNTVCSCPFAFRAVVISVKEPFLAELLPVTMSARLPNVRKSGAFFTTQSLPQTMRVGI